MYKRKEATMAYTLAYKEQGPQRERVSKAPGFNPKNEDLPRLPRRPPLARHIGVRARHLPEVLHQRRFAGLAQWYPCACLQRCTSPSALSM